MFFVGVSSPERLCGSAGLCGELERCMLGQLGQDWVRWDELMAERRDGWREVAPC